MEYRFKWTIYNLYKNNIVPVQSLSPSPWKPGLHLQSQCAGRLQHSALSTHREEIAGSKHSSISEIFQINFFNYIEFFKT